MLKACDPSYLGGEERRITWGQSRQRRETLSEKSLKAGKTEMWLKW
jgi:hypothetical protein